jgi:integrase
LLDTGVRASELLSIGRGDIDLVTGFALIRHGKGRKPRTVFFGKEVRKAVKAYLKMRTDSNPALWVNDEFENLTYSALLDLLKRRGDKAKVPHTTPHDFRRAFALGMLRNKVDIYTLQKLMGHADLQVLRRYLAQNDSDLAAAHRAAGLADRL